MSDNDWPRVIYNNSNPYPQKFLELLSTKKGYVLDCGSGDRKLDCDNVINFDVSYSKGVDIIGDGHKLPFKDDSFDLILSQAVLEHYRQPWIAAQEMYRVCRNGGVIHAGAAFMQPFHGIPYHFFNMTILGIEELLCDFEKIESGAFGGLTDTIPWIIKCTSASQKKILLKILIKIIHRLDAFVKPEELRSIASGVYFIGKKSRGDEIKGHKMNETSTFGRINLLKSLLICPTCGGSLEHEKINQEMSKSYSALDVKAEDKLVKKIGNWTITENPSALSKSLVMSNTAGDKLSYSFRGKLAVIYFLRHDWSGIAEIYLDGAFLESLDLYHGPYQYGFESMVDAEDDGVHTVDIVVTGEKSPKSNDCQIGVDGFGSLAYKYDEIFFCENCKTRFPVIDGVVDFSRHDDERVKKYNAFYNAFFKAGGDDVSEFDKIPEITEVGQFLKIDILDSLIQEDITDKTVVDVGCGPWGFACIFPKLQGCKIGIGIDIALTALRESNIKLSNYNYIASNQRIPLSNNSVDIVFAGEVLEHVANPISFIDDVHRVLKPNGIFILTTPNSDAFFYKRMGKKYADGPDHISLQNYKSLKGLLAGKFEIEIEKGINLSICPSMDCRIKNKALLKFWSRIFLNHPRYATGFIIKCRKIL
jgi:ubiquinone/menaquinone biosynthesis C-methylase UbiE/uncharacterized protein YbaR (Trm112 family)